MFPYQLRSPGPCVHSVNVSPGGIPKLPQQIATALTSGLVGDGRNHAKHLRPDRALSLWDYEILQEFVAEGYDLLPGTAGENLTVVDLNLQELPSGTILKIGDVLLKLEQPRKPCYVLDPIDPQLKKAVVGRFGYMASVVHEGTICAGMAIQIVTEEQGRFEAELWDTDYDSQARPGAMAYHMLAGPPVG